MRTLMLVSALLVSAPIAAQYANPYGQTFRSGYLPGGYTSQYSQPSYGAQTYGQSGYGQSAYGQPAYGGGSGYGQSSYSQAIQQPAQQATQQAPQQEFRPTQPELSEPELVLREGLEKLRIYIVKRDQVSEEQALKFVEAEIAPYFDFAYMAQWAAGSNWRYMNSGDKGELTEKVSAMFLKSLARNLGGYGDPEVTIRAARQGSNEVKIPVVVTPRNSRGVNVTLTFRFYRSERGWKIFDVTANNTSAVMYYRRVFSQQLRGYRNNFNSTPSYYPQQGYGYR